MLLNAKKNQRIGYLDTDIGQNEFSAEGIITLTIIDRKSPLLGNINSHLHYQMIPNLNNHKTNNDSSSGSGGHNNKHGKEEKSDNESDNYNNENIVENNTDYCTFYKPWKSVYIGDNSPANNPQFYLNSILHILNEFKSEHQF